jgi:DNA repair exonuclease SbcCD ATPase subunit
VLTAIEALAEKARGRRRALEDEVSSKERLQEARPATRNAIERAREALDEYRKSYSTAEEKWGPAALESAPAPEVLSSDLDEAVSLSEDAEKLAASGRFVEARSSLERAGSAAQNIVVGAPAALRTAVVEADRKKREGEEKLKELEARLKQAKANERFMSPLQHQQLRDYEYQLQNARSGFFGGDWLAALLLFEALDHNYTFMGDAPFMGAGGFGESDWNGGGWSGGDWNDGGGWGGGDWGGGGDFGGGDW